jgi:hypothetical protein
MASDPDDCPQPALFDIEGPDEDGCVWLVSGKGESAIVLNLGPKEPVAEKMADWLGQIDFGDLPDDN